MKWFPLCHLISVEINAQTCTRGYKMSAFLFSFFAEGQKLLSANWIGIKAKWGEFNSAKMKFLIFVEKMAFDKNDLFSCNPGHKYFNFL